LRKRYFNVQKNIFSEDLCHFLVASEGKGSLSTLHGHIFETITHASIANGGTFQVWPLDENADDEQFFN